MATELSKDAIRRYGELPVLRIVYEGEFKTSPSALANTTSLREGMMLSEVDPEAVDQALEATGLYSEISLKYELMEGGVELIIELKEKLTLFPIPVASYSDQTLTLGLMALDSDFLGGMSTVLAGGFWSGKGYSAALGFFDRRIGASEVGLSFFSTGGRVQHKEDYPDGTRFGSYLEDTVTSDLGLSFFNDHALRPFLNAKVQWSRLDPDDAEQLDMSVDTLYVEPSAGLVYDDHRAEGWFKSGFGAVLSYRLGLSAKGGSDFGFGGASADYTIKLPGDHALSLGGSAGYGNEPRFFDESLGGRGFRTLPYGRSFSTKYGAAYSNYEVPLVGTSWGTLTACAFYEAGLYEVGPEGEEEVEGFHGPGAGFRLYLKNAAIPAFGADFAYDVPFRDLVISVTLGFAK